VLYIVHVTAYCLGGPFFPDTVYIACYCNTVDIIPIYLVYCAACFE